MENHSALFKQIALAISAITFIELAAVIFGIAYLILIAKKKRLGWYFAFISSTLYVYLSFNAKIYIESGLQSFYCFMAVYGWYIWNKSKEEDNSVTVWPIKRHLLIILVSSIISIALGYIMLSLTDQQSPYLDAFTTVFSLATTYMVAHSILENWIYWIIIDLALAVLYYNQGFYLVSINYLLFSIIAIFAFISWYKSFKNQTSENSFHRT